MFDAFWLPGVEPAAFQPVGSADAVVRYPALEAAQVRAACSRIRSAADQARQISVPDRIQAIQQSLQALTDPGNSAYQQAVELIAQTAGYSPEMVRAVLDHISTSWTRTALEQLVDAELGDLRRLDRFVPDPIRGRRTMAFGPSLAAHIFSGNVPGVAVESLIRTLLVKSASFGKLAAEEPILPVLFTARLPEALRDTIALTYWPGGTLPLEEALFDEADAIIVYGAEHAVQSIRNRAPAGRRILVHGPRFSVGVIGRAATEADALVQTARDVAHAVALFDQQGCVSPHVVYIVGDYAAAHRFGVALAHQLDAQQRMLPRGRLNRAEAIAHRDACARAEFGAIAGQPIELLAGPGHAVIVDGNPAFQPSCLNRLVYVKPLPRLAQLLELLHPVREYLQSVALTGLDESETADLVLELGRLGVSRLTSFTQLPWPPLVWHHDGSRPLGELLRWVDWDA